MYFVDAHDGTDRFVEVGLQFVDGLGLLIQDGAVAGSVDQFNDHIDEQEGVLVFNGGAVEGILKDAVEVDGGCVGSRAHEGLEDAPGKVL